MEELDNNLCIYKCGYCGKETSMNEKQIINFTENELDKDICSCGNFSYCSSIKFKATINYKDWKIQYGICE